MKAKTLMVQGTASSVGKSVLVAALCRILRQDGFRVAPFKAQNMALNSFVTGEGGEIGRAQAVQAEAAGIECSVIMNPILLKPEADSHCQVVVLGRPWGRISAKEYYRKKADLWPVVVRSLERLRSEYEVVIIEGAGSPAEVNLREGDITNMRVALHAQSPVLLVGDIDRGGVFASLVGTLELLTPEERQQIRGLIINKFRGDLSLLQEGLTFLEGRTGLPVLGVVPYTTSLQIPEEDSVALEEQRKPVSYPTTLEVAVIRLPHISNFDDFDPLSGESVMVRYVAGVAELGRPDLIILPGTKTTVADLLFLRRSGLEQAILCLAQAETPIIGICGGYQMLGKKILDPQHVESEDTEVEGLGLLPMVTTFKGTKRTVRVRAKVIAGEGLLGRAQGEEVTGYEIHMGQSRSPKEFSPFRILSASGCRERFDGAMAPGGMVFGTYLHGLFHNEGLRRSLLQVLAEKRGLTAPYGEHLEKTAAYDRLAKVVRESLDMVLLYEIAGLRRF